MKPKLLIIIGPSQSGKSVLSNKLVNDFPNKFSFYDYDDIAGKVTFEKEKSFDSLCKIMENFVETQLKENNGKIIISNSISDKFIKNSEDVDYKKIYIDEKFIDKERNEAMHMIKSNDFFTDAMVNWNTLYDPQKDFIYNRENYNELLTFLNNL